MSGYNRFDEAWERRKAYLFRSLFEDPPLSIIREEREDSSTRAEDTRTLAELGESPLSIEAQDESPLPELIIEVEKKPTNDESPEFYKKLEILMKGLVKKYLSDETRSVAVRQEDLIIDSDVSSEEISEKSQDVHSATDSDVLRDLSNQEDDEAESEGESKAEPEEEAMDVLEIASDVSRQETSTGSMVRPSEIVRRGSSNDIAVNDMSLKKIPSSESLIEEMEPDASSMQSEEKDSSSTSFSGDPLATTSASKSEGGVDLPSTAEDNEDPAEQREPSPSSPNEFHYGRPSLLPELFIKVEAKPTNDEVDTFYTKLEILMKCLVKKYLSGDKTSKAIDAREVSITDSDSSTGKSQDVHSGRDSNVSRDLPDQNGYDNETDSKDRFEAESEQGATDELAITKDVSRENTSSPIVLTPEIMRRRKSDSNDITVPEKKKKSTNSLTTPSREMTHDIEPDFSVSNGHSEEESSLSLSSDVAGEAETPKSGRDAFKSTSAKRRSTKNLVTSTSVTDISRTADEPESGSDSGRNILNNLFIGTPTIYKLCSCIDHECS